MGGFWKFMSDLVKAKKGKDSSPVVVKNYISGNNNQKNSTSNKNNGSRRGGTANKSKYASTSKKRGDRVHPSVYVSVQRIKLYATGPRGKEYTNKFHKWSNHNFGIEVTLKNTSNKTQTVHLGHCIYDNVGNVVFKGNFSPKISPYTTLRQDIFVDAKAFAKMKNGKYASQVWLDDQKQPTARFTVVN